MSPAPHSAGLHRRIARKPPTTSSPAGFPARRATSRRKSADFAAAVATRADERRLPIQPRGVADPILRSGEDAAARNQLERLSKVTQFRTEALRALLDNALRQNQTDAANELAQALQMSPQVTFADYLLCLELYRKLNSKKFDALLDKVKPVAAREGHDLAQLLSWMNKNGLADAALKWSDKLPADLTNRPPAAIAVAEALARTKNWSRLKRWTRSGSWGDDDYLRLAYQAYACRRSRRTSAEAEAEFDALWNSADAAAAAQPEHELALARLASTLGPHPEAEQLWLRVAKVPAARREALDALYAFIARRTICRIFVLTAQRLHQSSPEEVGLAANAARFALLLDHNAAAGRALAKQAYDKAPNDPRSRSPTPSPSTAPAGRRKASAILENFRPTSSTIRTSPSTPHFSTTTTTQLDAANKYIALARGGTIFPEEKQLLDEITTRRQNAAPASTPSPSPSQD